MPSRGLEEEAGPEPRAGRAYWPGRLLEVLLVLTLEGGVMLDHVRDWGGGELVSPNLLISRASHMLGTQVARMQGYRSELLAESQSTGALGGQ